MLVVDARDGRILAEWSVRFGDSFRWTELPDVESFGDDVFDASAFGDAAEQVVWFAFGSDDVPEELREQHETEEREAAGIAGRLDLDDVVLPTSGDVDVTVLGDGFVCFWSAEGHVRFGRRRVAEPADDEGVSLAWVDSDWHWFVQGHGVDRASVEAFADRLRRAPLD